MKTFKSFVRTLPKYEPEVEIWSIIDEVADFNNVSDIISKIERSLIDGGSTADDVTGMRMTYSGNVHETIIETYRQRIPDAINLEVILDKKYPLSARVSLMSHSGRYWATKVTFYAGDWVND